MKRGFFLFFLLIFSSSALFADEVYPEITELYAADPQYAQLCLRRTSRLCFPPIYAGGGDDADCPLLPPLAAF